MQKFINIGFGVEKWIEKRPERVDSMSFHTASATKILVLILTSFFALQVHKFQYLALLSTLFESAFLIWKAKINTMSFVFESKKCSTKGVHQGFKQIKEPNRTIYYTCFKKL